MGSKKYKNKTCVYCAKEKISSTGDHIFAREFFLDNERDNLPQVPACEVCNNIKSELEHYLTAVLPFGGQHSDSLSNLSSMVPKRLNKNKKLHKSLRSGMRRGWFVTDSGVLIKSTSIPIDFDKIERLMEYIVRGLCWEHMRVQLLEDDFVKVMAVTKHGENYFRNKLFSLNCNLRINRELGKGTVSYEGIQGTDDPKRTVWSIKLYGGIQMSDSEGAINDRTNTFVLVTADKRESEIAQQLNY